MANRKAVSISVRLYKFLKVYCEANNVSLSGVVEDAVRDRLDVPDLPEERARRGLRPPRELKPSATPVQAVPPVAPVIVPPRSVSPEDKMVIERAKQFAVGKPPEVQEPCRRENCSWLHLHEAGTCK